MNLLVVGGCGFTGSVLVNDLLKEGHRVTVFDAHWFGCHLEHHERLTVLVGDIRHDQVPMKGIEAVVHLANVANDPSVDLRPDLTWEVNVLATMSMVEAAIKAGVSRFIYASSGSVYGVKKETEVIEDLELVPISTYNKTKMVAERVLMSYQDRIKIWIVRPATVCGISPRMRLDLSVNLLTYQALKNSKITVFGGDQVRPNIHIDDLSAVYRHLLSGNVPEGTYNAGFENISILTMANEIASKTGAQIVVTESNDPRSYRQNSAKLTDTGFSPRKGVSEAIDEVIAAFEQGQLHDQDDWNNVRSMIAKGLT